MSPHRTAIRTVIFLLLLIQLPFYLGCGLNRGGASGYINDILPADAVALGTAASFSTVTSGKTVSGVVTIYRSASNNQNFLYIQSLSAPNESPLFLEATYSNGTPFSGGATNLKSSSGNQLYPTNVYSATNNKWVSVTIISRSTGSDVIYGAATFP